MNVSPSSSSSITSSPHSSAVMILAFGATMSMVMGVASVIPMIPKLSRVFEVTLPQASLVITVFTLPGIVFTLLAGILADRFGRKPILVPSLLLFSLAGTGCAFAPDFDTLLMLRFLQGIGAASLGVLNTTILADTWSNGPLRRMVGYNMSVLSVCTALYPVIGGVLAYFDWRYPFYLFAITLPVTVIAVRTPLKKPTAFVAFRDYLKGLKQTFQSKRMVSLFIITMLTFMLLYGPIFTCFPVLADTRFGANTAMIGSAMIVASIGTALVAFRIGRLSERYSARNLLFCSLGLYIATLVLLPLLPNLWWALFPIFLYGLGQGLNIPNVQTQLLETAPAEQRASVMSMNGMLLRMGQTIGPVSFSFLMEKQGLVSGFYGGVVLSVCLGVMVFLFIPKKTV